MFIVNFYTMLLQLNQGWIVKSVETDFSEQEIYIEISCILDQFVDEEIGEVCKFYDPAPVRSLRHLGTMQYKTFIKVSASSSSNDFLKWQSKNGLNQFGIATPICLNMW